MKNINKMNHVGRHTWGKRPGLSLLGDVKLQLEIRRGRKHLELAHWQIKHKTQELEVGTSTRSKTTLERDVTAAVGRAI